jgi:hypothetical protein
MLRRPDGLAADVILPLKREALLDAREGGLERVAVGLDGKVRQRFVVEFRKQSRPPESANLSEAVTDSRP